MSDETVEPSRTGNPVPVRDDLVEVTPYGAPQLDVAVRLNTNETPEPPPAAYLDAVGAALHTTELHRYPDRPASKLREVLGEAHGLDTAQVWVANGSNEVLVQLFQAYGGPGRRMLLFRPGYSAHPLIARVSGTGTVEHDLPDDFTPTPDLARAAVEEHQPDIITVASPNNPTGIVVDHPTIRALHDTSQALVVVDEAYVEFAPEGVSARSLLDDLPRLVVARTFSKAYRLAGLRLGYLLAHDWVVDDLRKVRLPYHVDAIKQIAGEVAVTMRGAMLTHIPEISAERDRVEKALRALPGIERVWHSAANFVLFRTAVDDLFDRLLERGVLIRDFSDKPRLGGCLRVTIGTPDENDAFLTALTDVLKEA
ncbi:MAG: histidinol-phosphate transaminase [Nitriliruptorales bacterium]|nr:histidinol-phosphate transaminase [Nitriliruptorales bacterium]